MVQVYDIIVQKTLDSNTSLDGKNAVIKTYLGDTRNHGILNSATKLTRAEAVLLKRSAAYQGPINGE